ncbi:hypothetical protein ABZ297_46115, partial [Nonomuraea sp. NPDC005983]|uniref:hypothetical protein n=1 Tax=Nonomuraea sp. NPDC005983 TaxID=3155595 RepID=UPI0033A17054
MIERRTGRRPPPHMDLIGPLVALAAMVAAFVPRVPVAWAASAAGIASIAITAAHPLTGRQADTMPWLLVELPPLLVLVLRGRTHQIWPLLSRPAQSLMIT